MEGMTRTRWARFGAFEVDLRSGELRKHGIRLKLQHQPFQVLALLIEHPGEVVTREELRQKLWPADTFVDFDTGLNSAIKKLRDALSDSAEESRYIETLPRRGYRFVAHVEKRAPSDSAAEEVLAPHPPPALVSKPGNKRLIFVAACVIALLAVVALASWKVFFVRPALTGTDVILLARFVNKTGDPIFDDSLDKALEVKLTESPFLSIFPDSDVRETMRTMRHDPNERVTQDMGIEICRRRGLKAVVVPEIAAVGNKYLVTLDAIDARNQRSIARRQEEAQTKDDVVAALGKAGSRLRRQLGESLSSLQNYDVPLELATTSSLEALQAYSTGRTLYRSGERHEAIALYQRATELDPQFCSAYSALGSAYHSIGDGEASSTNFAKALELKDRRLTQQENFETTALYHSAITGNLDKETAVLVLYEHAYPRSVDALNLLGIAYAQMGRTQEALEQFYSAIDRSPTPSAQHYSNAAQALMILGRFDEARNLLDQWQQHGALTPFQRVMRYRIAFIANDLAAMDRIATGTPADDAPWLRFQIELAFLRGDFVKLRSLTDRLVDQQMRAKRIENAAEDLAVEAADESSVGNFSLARNLCRQVSVLDVRSARELMKCSEALSDAGDVTQAESLAAELDRQFPEDTFQQDVLLPVLRSDIERRRGNVAKAVDLLASLTQYPNVLVFYYRAEAYSAAGDYAQAAANFETVITHRGWPDWEKYAPLAQLGLARAYARQRDTEESRRAYDDLFATWKNADPEIPILRQAKAEFASLRTNPER
jgi:DNA-binding winged helix-turn-helix (wHTH) protein/tetratricopeptide (TPR) repeat protein